MNKATTPRGRVFRRGEAVLCNFNVGTFTAHIDRIEPGEVGEVTVRLSIMTGHLRTLGAMAHVETPIATQYGFYHQSTKLRLVGNAKPQFLFCFADEEPEWTEAAQAPEAPPVEVSEDDQATKKPERKQRKK